MQITEKEERLLQAFRRLPADTASQVSTLVQQLAEHSKIDWSDEWSDSDLAEFTADSLRQYDLNEQKH